MTTDLIASYRSAAARMREMEAAAKHDCHCPPRMHTDGCKMARKARNLLLPLLDAGDALANWLECMEKLYPDTEIKSSNCNFGGGYVAAKAALAALPEALERECGGAV